MYRWMNKLIRVVLSELVFQVETLWDDHLVLYKQISKLILVVEDRHSFPCKLLDLSVLNHCSCRSRDL